MQQLIRNLNEIESRLAWYAELIGFFCLMLVLNVVNAGAGASAGAPAAAIAVCYAFACANAQMSIA